MNHGGTENTEIIFKELTGALIGAAIEVHRELGPGLLESTYQACLARELALRAIAFEQQKPLPVFYKVSRLIAATDLISSLRRRSSLS